MSASRDVKMDTVLLLKKKKWRSARVRGNMDGVLCLFSSVSLEKNLPFSLKYKRKKRKKETSASLTGQHDKCANGRLFRY